MKINVLTLLMILLASNTFAEENTYTIPNLYSLEENKEQLLCDVDFFQQKTQNPIVEFSNINSEYTMEIDSLEKKYEQLLHDVDSSQQETENTIVELSNNNIEHIEKIDYLEKKYEQFLRDVDYSQQETENTIVELSNNNSEHAKKIDSLGKKYEQILYDVASFQQEIENTIAPLPVKIDKTRDVMKSDHQQLSTRLDMYRQKTDIELRNTFSQQKTYFIVALLSSLVLVLIVYFYFKKQLVQQQDSFTASQNNIQKLREEGVELDQKLIDIIETQLKILESKPGAEKKEEPDHTLALKVADEIIRIQKNLSNMDEKTKGLKQLSASVKRIQDNFASNGYEIVEMLGQPYKEGMKVQANFIPDDELEDGQEIITRIIKPQVNYKGEMIQSAQIEVSQG